MFNICFSNYILSYNLTSDEIIDNYENDTVNGSNYEWGSTKPGQHSSNPNVAGANTLSLEDKSIPLTSGEYICILLVFLLCGFSIYLYFYSIWCDHHKNSIFSNNRVTFSHFKYFILIFSFLLIIAYIFYLILFKF